MLRQIEAIRSQPSDMIGSKIYGPKWKHQVTLQAVRLDAASTQLFECDGLKDLHTQR